MGVTLVPLVVGKCRNRLKMQHTVSKLANLVNQYFPTPAFTLLSVLFEGQLQILGAFTSYLYLIYLHTYFQHLLAATPNEFENKHSICSPLKFRFSEKARKNWRHLPQGLEITW